MRVGRALRQEGENGLAVLGRVKRTAALQGKLKGKGKGDQAQQLGAHAVPVDTGQEGQLIRGATTASAAHNSLAPSGPCSAAASSSSTAPWAASLARHVRNQETEASGRRASRRLPRGERRGHCRLCQGHRCSQQVGCRPVLSGPPGWSRRFSACLRVSNWEVIEPSRPTSPRQRTCTCWETTSGRRS